MIDPPGKGPSAVGAHLFRPTSEEVKNLIRRAARHPLGTDFLVQGAPDAVAATFGVHAFIVDGARARLADQQAAQ